MAIYAGRLGRLLRISATLIGWRFHKAGPHCGAWSPDRGQKAASRARCLGGTGESQQAVAYWSS